MKNPVIDFINRRFKGDSHWCDGNCYYFAVILKIRFPAGIICYDVINGHFVYKYRGKYYDWTGEIEVIKNNLVVWDSFAAYDYIQRRRIVKDCID